MGQADKVTMSPEGTVQVRRYLFLCDNNANCWEERSVRRMIFGHSGIATGHLFVGFNHGITHVFNDTFGDHTHVQTIWHYPDGQNIQRMGDQYGLALFPNGDVLTAGAYGVGMQPWNSDPRAWVDGVLFGRLPPTGQPSHTTLDRTALWLHRVIVRTTAEPPCLLMEPPGGSVCSLAFRVTVTA
jgi:hypothetical protein